MRRRDKTFLNGYNDDFSAQMSRSCEDCVAWLSRMIISAPTFTFCRLVESIHSLSACRKEWNRGCVLGLVDNRSTTCII